MTSFRRSGRPVAAPARVVTGRARVVREVRTTGPLAEALGAPVTARGPWLTAVLAHLAVRSPVRPVALVVDGAPGDLPSAAAFLVVTRLRVPRGGPVPGVRTVRLLTAAAGQLPGGRPTGHLLARDRLAATLLADGIAALLAAGRGPWRLDLAGLPLGDPTVAALAARLPTARLATERSVRLVAGERLRASVDPREVERRLPLLTATAPDRRAAAFLRTAVRVHAAAGSVEVADLPSGGTLLSLLDADADADTDGGGGDGDDQCRGRWAWRASGAAPVRTGMGAPVVRLSASGWGRGAITLPGAAR